MPSQAREGQDLPPVARALREKLPAERLILLPTELEVLSRDMAEPPRMFRRLLRAEPPVVGVRPRSGQELADAVAILRREGVPFTPRGLGSTGLGGAVPVAGGVVIDLSRLGGVAELDQDAGRARVRAGATFFHIQAALEPAGLRLASRPSNAFGTLGGWAAAGGLGLGSLRAGPLVERVASIRVVLPDGGQERLTPADAGFADFFDTEGQLGLFSSLRLELDRIGPPGRLEGLVLPDEDALAGLVDGLLGGDEAPDEVLLLGRVHDHPALSGEPDGEVVLVSWPSAGRQEAGRPEGVRALPKTAATRLWDQRFFPMDNHLGPVFLASEALLPAGRLPKFVRAVRRRARRYSLPLHLHGHAVRTDEGPRVLTLLLFPCDPAAASHHTLVTPLAAVLTSLARRHGGKPYGVGVWNTPFARSVFGPERLRRITDRKQRLDPDGLCNPGKFFSLGTRAKALPVLMGRGVYPSLLSMSSATGRLMVRARELTADKFSTAARCISCGACVPVCPAVAITGAESTSARAKLGLCRRLDAGQPVGDDELLGSQRCLMCGQCAQVCARGLDLVPAWEELESAVRQRVTDEAWQQAVADFAALADERRAECLEVALP